MATYRSTILESMPLPEEKPKPLFRNLEADDPEPEIVEIESLCLRCEKNGKTRILLTKIPFYKDVVIMSFCCDHCGWENNELQPAATIQEKGVVYKVKVSTVEDLKRQVVKTEWASVTIPELQFEIPARSQEGVVTTIEGLISRAVMGLTSQKEHLQEEDPVASEKISDFLIQLCELIEVKTTYHLVLDDPSGNSFIENFFAPQKDSNMQITHYTRSNEQDHMLGIMSGGRENSENDVNQNSGVGGNTGLTDEHLQDEVLNFQTNCAHCNSPCPTRMKVTKIPHFKEVIIMATTCDICGYKTNEVKSGSGIEPHGTRIQFKIIDPSDMNRDILKSETCSIEIPELELEVGAGTLGGRFTTIEGLLNNIKDQLKADNPLAQGDSADTSMKQRLDTFLKRLEEMIDCRLQATIILDDPCGNSYLQNLYAPDPDPNLNISNYERTKEQNDDLGISDMKTENYEEEAETKTTCL
ncbi:zinc finger protein Zpr1 isoform X2 [Tachypleus tridentatus]|uniref:zinc finger protein Zpr1 isoform X2 n=1 Tax=Tachypleus tridentatus TaxID=6853 RepID=UPI003FD459CC